MHFIIGAVLHATVLGVIAFFVLFAAGKAEGFVSLLGRLLGFWLLLLAILSIAAGAYFHLKGGKPDEMGWMHGHGWMHHWGPPDGAPPPPAQPAATPAPAPTTPAPATPAKP